MNETALYLAFGNFSCLLLPYSNPNTAFLLVPRSFEVRVFKKTSGCFFFLLVLLPENTSATRQPIFFKPTRLERMAAGQPTTANQPSSIALSKCVLFDIVWIPFNLLVFLRFFLTLNIESVHNINAVVDLIKVHRENVMGSLNLALEYY